MTRGGDEAREHLHDLESGYDRSQSQEVRSDKQQMVRLTSQLPEGNANARPETRLLRAIQGVEDNC